MIHNLQKNKTVCFLFLAILLLGTLVRLWKLSTAPLPPNGDELAYGYYGWSLYHFGTDEFGKKLPLYFSSIGDYKYPLLAYLNALPAGLFGLADILPRIIPTLSGIILITGVFFLSFTLFSNWPIALLASFFAAFSPWGIMLSRTAHEVTLGMVLTLAATLLTLHAAMTKKANNRAAILKTYKLLACAFVLFIASAFSYGSQRVFIPALLTGLVLLAVSTSSHLATIKNELLGLLVITSVAIAISLIPWQSRARASGVVFKGIAKQDIEESIHSDGIGPVKTPLILTRVYHNKLTASALESAARYAAHFDTGFLFFTGDRSPDSVPDTGVFLHIELFLFIAGVLGVWQAKNTAFKNVAYIWLLAGPTAAAITEGGPHFFRASNMFIAVALFSGYGLYYLLNQAKKYPLSKILRFGIWILLLTNISFTWHNIFIHKVVDAPWYSDQGKKELVGEVLARKADYQAVAMPEYPYIFFLYYGKITPKEFITDADIKPESQENQWERVSRLSNIYFGMPYDCPKGGKLNVLYVCKGSEVPQNARVLKTIYYLDGVPAYTLIDFFPFSQPPEQEVQLPVMIKYMQEKETKYPDGILPADNPTLW